MGLLEALHFHADQSKYERSNEVEYRCYAWGEIFAPYVGDREHSNHAKNILYDFPFKLFISSEYGRIPQKICLTFKAPLITRENLTSDFSDEIAKEFVAFLSLVTRRRVVVGKRMRINGLPIEDEKYPGIIFMPQEMQSEKEIQPYEINQLLNGLVTMDAQLANSFVLAMLLYQSAIEMMYTEPEFAYLLLIDSLEAISSQVNKYYMPDKIEDFLTEQYPRINEIKCSEDWIIVKELILKKEHFISKKIWKFVNDNIPEKFWSENIDDAKPDYHFQVIRSSTGPSIENSDKSIQPFEKFGKEDLWKKVRDIYNSRSQLIHEGKRLPPSIVMGHYTKVSPEALVDIFKKKEDGTVIGQEFPILPLLTFERLVSYSLVNFLKKQSAQDMLQPSD
jgi:hypothetical protein